MKPSGAGGATAAPRAFVAVTALVGLVRGSGAPWGPAGRRRPGATLAGGRPPAGPAAGRGARRGLGAGHSPRRFARVEGGELSAISSSRRAPRALAARRRDPRRSRRFRLAYG